MCEKSMKMSQNAFKIGAMNEDLQRDNSDSDAQSAADYFTPRSRDV